MNSLKEAYDKFLAGQLKVDGYKSLGIKRVQ
jgi:hypothetical protein